MAKTNEVIDKDKGYKKFLKNWKSNKGRMVVTIGVQGSQAQQDHGGVTNVDIATWMEYGTEHMEERSLIRATADENKEAYKALIRKLALRVSEGKSTRVQALNILGAKILADMQKRMRSGLEPKLSDATIAAIEARIAAGGPQRFVSGFKPFMDSGSLFRALTYLVQRDKGE